jgi:hypothetical protein
VQQIERTSFSVAKLRSIYIYIYIYMNLKFMALQGAPYIHDIRRLRVNGMPCLTVD